MNLRTDAAKIKVVNQELAEDFVNF